MNAAAACPKRGDPSMQPQYPTPPVDDGPKLRRDAPATNMQSTPQAHQLPLGTQPGKPAACNHGRRAQHRRVEIIGKALRGGGVGSLPAAARALGREIDEWMVW